ncbi:MAG: hypothetical protein JO131_02975, partial [Gammaproteobacteria bacterium]|nr:hypothetical protein [Gammaproteobacteria bacterium]
MKKSFYISLCHLFLLTSASFAYADDSLTVENVETNIPIYIKHEYGHGPAFDSVLPHDVKTISRDEVSTACKKDLVCKI